MTLSQGSRSFIVNRGKTRLRAGSPQYAGGLLGGCTTREGHQGGPKDDTAVLWNERGITRRGGIAATNT